MKTAKIITITIILTIALLVVINPIAKATIDPSNYEPTGIDTSELQPVTNIAGIIVNALAVIGTVVTMITLIVIGIKYMMGSVEEKAEYKKTMIPYLIGAFMIFGITQFLNIIVKTVNGL